MRPLVIAVAAMLSMTALDPSWSGGRPFPGQSKTTASPPSTTDLDRLLAPVALYPDALLGQMLLCAVNAGKVGALREWMLGQGTVTGSELQDAARQAGFEESFVALAVFPEVVDWMADQSDWTARLGEAFAADRSSVFASIQRLRAKATAAGTLKSTPQQEVETRTTSSGQQVIVIEPANPQVVYVPQYNPELVYTSSSTVVVQGTSSSDAVAAGLIGFTAGIAIGAAFDNDYYYGPYGWGGGYRMYDDAWDDWYDHREDAREDWMDHREDLADERGDLARSQQEQRTERQQNRQENRPESSAARDERRTQAQSAAQTRSSGTASEQARGYSREGGASAKRAERSGSDAFSNYSSGRSERAASQRGKSSRSSSRGSGGRRR
jgi:hypothetical protein